MHFMLVDMNPDSSVEEECKNLYVSRLIALRGVNSEENQRKLACQKLLLFLRLRLQFSTELKKESLQTKNEKEAYQFSRKTTLKIFFIDSSFHFKVHL